MRNELHLVMMEELGECYRLPIDSPKRHSSCPGRQCSLDSPIFYQRWLLQNSVKHKHMGSPPTNYLYYLYPSNTNHLLTTIKIASEISVKSNGKVKSLWPVAQRLVWYCVCAGLPGRRQCTGYRWLRPLTPLPTSGHFCTNCGLYHTIQTQEPQSELSQW